MSEWLNARRRREMRRRRRPGAGGSPAADLGLVYGLQDGDEGTVALIDMTTAACPLTDVIEGLSRRVRPGRRHPHHRV